jgi:twitching motility protein PilT
MSLQPTETLRQLLRLCHERGCSDLHLSAGMPPVGRHHGELRRLAAEILDETAMERLAEENLAPADAAQLAAGRSVDAACGEGGQRFRLNFYRERGCPALAIRRLEPRIPSLAELHLPPALADLTAYPHGLVLVTGPTGSGKSTTLAALLDHINRERACHILTIEDPVEYLHESRTALVHQREVGSDTPGFAEALREAMREDPDVILVGEMRDLATARAALTAAETGHLVFSTLHCGDSVGALDRILALYPAEEQDSARRQLAQTLRAVVAQTLLPRLGEEGGRRAAVELLLGTPAVENLIRTGQFNQLYNALETGMSQGMVSFEQSLASLVRERAVDREIARQRVRNPRLFDQLTSSPAPTRRV